MKKNYSRTSIMKQFLGIFLFLFIIFSEANAQGCAGGSICNWSGGPYRYPGGSSAPVSLGCITTQSGNSWTSYGPSWGGPGTPLLVFTAVAGQDYTFTLTGGQATGSNYLINIHTGNTAGAGVCVKTATARFGGAPWATSCTLNITAAELTAGNDYIVQFAECGETAGSCVSVYRFGTTPDEFIGIDYGQTGVAPPAQPSVIAGPSPTCVGTTQTYSVTNTPGVTYTWSVSAGGTIMSGQGTNIITVNWTTTGSKTLSVTPSNASCSGTARNRTITVNTVPTPVTVNTSGTYCGSTTLTATGGTTRYWQGTTSGGTSTATPSSSQVVTVSGTYYFRANNACGWGTEGSATVTINPYPVVNAIGGGAASVMVSASTPPFTNSTPGGTWSITNGTGSATINASGVATGTSAGSVTVNYSVTVNGCTTVVTTPLTVTIFMPVELLSLSAVCDDTRATIGWITASEKNNDRFYVERSADADVWKQIGAVIGAGTSSFIHEYEFTDIFESGNKNSDQLFYRLRQVDFDGKQEYLGPVTATCTSSDDWQLILENFSSDELIGKLTLRENAEVHLKIMDLQGRTIQKGKLSAAEGVNDLQINTSNLDKGIYLIKLEAGSKNIVAKFVKQ